MKRLFSFAVFAAVCGNTHAVGIAQGVTLNNIDVRTDGSFLVSFSQSISTPSSCATDFSRMTGSANTPGGRAVLASAMLAHSMGSVVFAQGSGNCSEYGGIESLLILVQRR